MNNFKDLFFYVIFKLGGTLSFSKEEFHEFVADGYEFFIDNSAKQLKVEVRKLQ